MKMNQVTVPSIDLKKGVEFYQTLGFKLIVDSVPRYARFVAPDGDASFSLHLVDKLPTGKGIMLYFECDNLDQKVDELVSKGIKFEQMPMDQSWLWREAYLRDPDGNLLVLYHAGENRLNPPWKIK